MVRQPRYHPPPQFAVHGDAVDEHDRRSGATFAIADRARRHFDAPIFAQLWTDRHDRDITCIVQATEAVWRRYRALPQAAS
jgi:hypothetical protein